MFFFFSSRRRHTRWNCDWSSDVCSSDLLDIQHEFPGGVVMNAGYNGAKGTRLDTKRALVVPGGQPFVYESSEGNSILHAASVRVRKRMAKGLGLSAQYVFSKSIDDASSIGGGGNVV